jgi:hypothetical protein
MWAAVLNAPRGAPKVVLVTLLGGDAFGNEGNWIIDAIRRSFCAVSAFDIDARIVSFGRLRLRSSIWPRNSASPP